MSENIVSIHVPSRKTPIPSERHVDPGLSGWGRPTLANALSEFGLKALFSRGPGALDFDRGTILTLKPKIEQKDGEYIVYVDPALMAIESIDAFRNITRVIDHDVPELNHPDLRRLTGNKLSTNHMLAEIGLAKAYTPVRDDISEALTAIPGETAVLKPVRGKRSQHIFIGSKQNVIKHFHTTEVEGVTEWMVEQQLDFSPPVPVRGANSVEQEKIDLANKNKLPKELRVYSFGRDDKGKLISSYVLRVAKEGDSDLSNDDWVYVDSSSVPQQVVDHTELVTAQLEKTVGRKELHFAIDWAYAVTQDQPDPRWLPMEINSGEPELIRESENKEVAVDQARKLAYQLYRVAKKRSTM